MKKEHLIYLNAISSHIQMGTIIQWEERLADLDSPFRKKGKIEKLYSATHILTNCDKGSKV